MAAVPRSSTAATITIPVRNLVIGTALALLAATVVYGLHWVTGLQPLRAGSYSTTPVGLSAEPGSDSTYATGPPMYRWSRGGAMVYTIEVYNTSSLPMTVTGVQATSPGSWGGPFVGPTLSLPPAHQVAYTPGAMSPFRPVSIAAGGDAMIAFTFHANPRSCPVPHGGGGSSATLYDIVVRTRVLGSIDGTQTLTLDTPLIMHEPTRADCAG